MICDQVCDRDQVDVDHYKRSQSEECGPHHVTRDQEGECDQGDNRDRDQWSGI